jgi:hypothetical protein
MIDMINPDFDPRRALVVTITNAVRSSVAGKLAPQVHPVYMVPIIFVAMSMFDDSATKPFRESTSRPIYNAMITTNTSKLIPLYVSACTWIL